jgi:glutamate-1-semialdehyde 2,1-aminomutase
MRGPDAWLAAEVRTYTDRTSRSRKRFEIARKVLPGGDTRSITFYEPYPVAIAAAGGIQLTDMDGNRYRDFLLNYTSLITGHRHPVVQRAARLAMDRVVAVAAPAPGQVELATELADRIPSVERVRFLSSGTEAAMLAVRIARAVTGRSVVIKAIGGYHGSYPDLDFMLRPGSRPLGVPESSEVVAVPYNDTGRLVSVVEQLGERCAAILLEPALGAAGIVPGDAEYLRSAERVARRNGALFILDEVITFRLGRGGLQGLLGLSPDLTVLGKIIGGGFPVGALGGRAEPMEVLAPRGERSIAHSGTFNGNPVTMAAGLAGLKLLTPSAYAHLDALGARLADGIRAAFASSGVTGSVTQVGSLLNVHFTGGPVNDADGAWSSDKPSMGAFHLGLLNRGVFVAPRGMLAVSLATTANDVDAALAAIGDTLTGMCGDMRRAESTVASFGQ